MKTNKMILFACALVATAIAACSPDNQPTSPMSEFAGKVPPPSTPPSSNTINRPVTDFLKMQGSYCDPDQSGSCVTYVGPTANMLTWFDQNRQMAVWVDYAGLGDQWVMQQNGGQKGFGTNMTGGISEELMPDGRAQVTIDLQTNNAMAFVTQGPDLKGSPVIFGHHLRDVMNPATPPGLGTLSMHVVMINNAPGAPLPDLIQLIKAPMNGQQLVSMDVKFNGNGQLGQPFTDVPNAYGTMTLYQNGPAVGNFAGLGQLNGPGASADVMIAKSEPQVSSK